MINALQVLVKSVFGVMACMLCAVALAAAPAAGAAAASDVDVADAAGAATHPIPDMTRTGSITVALTTDDAPVAGGAFELYRVGTVRRDDGDYAFQLADAFAGSGVSLDEAGLASAQTARNLADYAADHDVAPTVEAEVGTDGSAVFSGLELGVYLLVQSQPAPGYEPVDPFVASVPLLDGGIYVYDVDASPKMGELEPSSPDTPDTPDVPETPDKPSEPTDPGKPADPTDPTGPTGPADPGKPSEPTLPQTGQLNWPIPLLAVAGLVLLVLGWVLRRGRSSGVASCSAAHSANPADSAGTQS